MNIGIEAQRIFRVHKHGMDFVALELIRQLQRLDRHNNYHIFVKEGPDRCIEESDNFFIHTFKGGYPIWEQVKLPKLAKQLNLDLLHCTSNTAPLGGTIPLVVIIHDIIYFEFHPLFTLGYTLYQRFGNIYRRLVVSRLIKRANAIYTVSYFEHKRLTQFFGLPNNRVQVIYNGVSSHFQPNLDPNFLHKVREKYNLPERYCLFLGNTDPKKNTRNTVVAFAQYCKAAGRTHHLMVADSSQVTIHQYLVDAGLEEFTNQIQVIGYIDNREMPALMNMADLFLYPSKREGFGIPILEGMATGTPVLTSNVASMPEVAGNAAYLVDPFNVNDITQGLISILSDEEIQKNLRKKGLERAKEFSWERTAKATLASYRRIVDQDVNDANL